MTIFKSSLLSVSGLLLAGLCIPAHATVTIVSVTPSVTSPQKIGQVITYTVTATDTHPGPLTFQFAVAAPRTTTYNVVSDFNTGKLSAGTWTAQPFVWSPTVCSNVAQSNGVVALTCQEIEGTYSVQVIAKDWGSGESFTKTVKFQIDAWATGTTPVVRPTANPLVALFSAPSCAAGSQMRVKFKPATTIGPTFYTNWVNCHPPATMNFQIAGMYASTTYDLYGQVQTAGKITTGPPQQFTTDALPSNLSFPTAKQIVPPTSSADTALPLLLLDPHQFGSGPIYPNIATDLSGKVMWYYTTNPPANLIVARPLINGTILTIEDGQTWNPASNKLQVLKQIDLLGNIIRETNTGIIQQLLVAKGYSDAAPCTRFPNPQVGDACLDDFHHDAIQTLPNGYTAVLASIEKIFPIGTQGDISGKPVDVLGDMVVILDNNWQVVWAWDEFEHLNANVPPILGETCTKSAGGCSPMFLLGSSIAPLGKDWTHTNSIYYWPKDQGGVAGQLIISMRNQDLVVKVDYKNGAGTGNILWAMGWATSVVTGTVPTFTFNNTNNDPWPWFSAQHEADFENNGKGALTLFDNGNTRQSAPPVGLGNPGCKPNDCNSRGMALTVSESAMTVTPVISQDLGVAAVSGGNGQLLPNGDYYFSAVNVFSLSGYFSYAIELKPTAGTVNGTQVFNLQDTEGYRGWQLTSLYAPPIT